MIFPCLTVEDCSLESGKKVADSIWKCFFLFHSDFRCLLKLELQTGVLFPLINK